MSRKLEIRTRMAEVQKEFSALTAEMKELDVSDKRVANLEKFKDYLYKVGTFGHTLEVAEKIKDVTNEDRETAHVGMSGLAYTGYKSHSQEFDYILLRTKEEYARTQNILTKLEAAQHVADDKVKDKEKWLKILLGET
jgi:flavodoxin